MLHLLKVMYKRRTIGLDRVNLPPQESITLSFSAKLRKPPLLCIQCVETGFEFSKPSRSMSIIRILFVGNCLLLAFGGFLVPQHFKVRI